MEKIAFSKPQRGCWLNSRVCKTTFFLSNELIMLVLLFSSSSERKGRANARNATLETLYGVQFIWFTQLIQRNHPVILHHRRSTTVSLDKNPRNTLWSHHLFNDKETLQGTSGGMGRNLYPSLPGFTIISISLKALGWTCPAHTAELYVNATYSAVSMPFIRWSFTAAQMSLV